MPRKKAKKTVTAEAEPITPKKAVGQAFMQSINSAVRLSREELLKLKDFYSANAAAETQFRRISREQGCRC